MSVILILILSAYIALQTSTVQTRIAQFITQNLSQKLDTKISVGKVNIVFFDQVVVNDVLIEDQNADTLFFIDKLTASIDYIKFRERQIALSSVLMANTKAYVSLDENRFPNYKFLLDELRNQEKDNSKLPWDLSCQNFIFEDTQLGYSYYQKDVLNLIDLQNIDLDISDIALNEDSISLKINSLSFTDNKSFILNELSGQIVSYEHVLKLNNLKVITPNSTIENVNFSLDQSNIKEGDDYTSSEVNIDLQQSTVDFRDVAQLIPSLEGMDLKLEISGNVYGTIADLKAKDLAFRFGEHTNITCDFYINGLPDLENAFIDINLKNSSTDFNDIAQINMPSSTGKKHLEFPAILYDAGIINYKGNFSGFIGDFVSYGTLESNFGYLNTDLIFSPGKDNILNIDGHLKTVNFDVGKFAQTSNLGNITFNGEIDGSYNEINNLFSANIDGVIDSVLFKNYLYKNVVMDGLLDEQKFEGNLSIDDQNLKGSFAGTVDFNEDIPVFDFELLLDHANLTALNLDSLHLESNLSVDMKANFTGNNLDNINGNIWIEEGKYSNENNSFVLNSLNLSTFEDSVKHLQLKSDFLDFGLSGIYSFSNIEQSFKNLIYRYIPASGIEYAETDGNTEFYFVLDIKETEPITQTFLPKLHLSKTQIIGSYNEANNKMDLYTDIPEIQYDKLFLQNYSIAVHTNGLLQINSRVDELKIGENQTLHNLSFVTDITNNGINNKILWDNYEEEKYSGEIETNLKFSTSVTGNPHIEMNILPSNFILADTVWNISPSTISIDSTRIEIHDLNISNKLQSLTFNGVISDNTDDKLDVTINNVSLNNIDLLSTKSIDIEGELEGTVSVYDVYGQTYLLSDISIQNTFFKNQKVGDVSIQSKWDTPSESLQSELYINNDSIQTIYAYGDYSPSKDSLDFSVTTNHLTLSLLQTVLSENFQDIHGYGTGEVKITGSSKNILINGDIFGENAGLTLAALQVPYEFSDTVSFRGDSIIFDNITVFDPDGNSAIFDGSIKHSNFADMDYNLSVSTPKMLVLNTSIRDNQKFYGKAYGDGVLQITGNGGDLYLDGTATTLDGTIINISLDYEEGAKQYDFIRFVNTEEKKTEEAPVLNPPRNSRLYMNFNIEATTDATFQLIYNSQIGDEIRAEGTGNLRIEVDPNFNISMYGEYRVDNGDYLFTLQNVINKKFEIEEGGTINWSGDPYNATIDINAIYQLRAALSELYGNSELYTNSNRQINYNQRIPVDCIIQLTGDLNNPNINFDIEFPSTEETVKDEVSQYFSNEEDMNKQLLSLLVLGRFYTPEYLRGSFESSNPNLVGSTASELFSNQLSNWLSQISNDFDIGVNYRPGSQVSNDEIELALSTQIFNDRVTLNGNIGNNGTQGTTANSNDIVGDFDLSVKLTNNGKLQFKAYNHSNNNIIYETSPYTQGIGLSYRENYNTFNELWQKFTRIFKGSK